MKLWTAATIRDAKGLATPENANQMQENGRIHFSDAMGMVSHANAIAGDYSAMLVGTPDANVWYAFTGDSFTYYAFSRGSGTIRADVFVDNQFVATVDLFYPFSDQPLAFHFDGFGDGPHVARISSNVGFRVDAFASNQPPVGYRPLAEWWESDRTAGASIWGGVHVPVAVGDVTGDGAVELVVASSNVDNSGELFLMTGDGRDAGGGDPIIWSVPFNIFNGFEHVGAPAIAELDGQPGAEIVMANTLGMYAFHSDGSTYWFTDTLKPHVYFGTPAVANLDLDPEPEIVINLDETLAVFEHDGALAWSVTDPDGLTMPLLADLTGDGLLDILVHDWDDTLYLYDYNLGTPQLVWTAGFTNPLHGYGSPAVADLDLDGTPEIAIASENWLFALNSEDGSVQWSAALGPGRTGGVTIADIDGDGAVELVVGALYNGGTLYAFEADGAPKWAVPALDGSPLNTAAADLDGDGAYELLWNGNAQGFTIYDGRTGDILFNEPLAYSATGSDVPVVADVDGDGFAEIVVPAHGGIRVFGFDGVWGPARPLWNQLNYHLTNINDDLSLPFNEANSWQVHNTYRAQTDLVHPLPSYGVSLTYTAAITSVTVLTDTFSAPPTTQADPVYGWEYGQDWTAPAVTRTFQSRVDGLQPGEARLVAEGAAAAYTLGGGSNWLTLPPLYVTAARLVSIEPAAQTVPAGAAAVYDLTLTNPSGGADTYTVLAGGPLAAWVSGPTAVLVPANSAVTVPLTVTIPAEAAPGTLPLLVAVSTGGNGADQTAADLTITDGVDVAVGPAAQAGQVGQPLTYTLTITNLEAAGQNYTVTPSGLAHVSLPGSFFVPAGQAADFAFTASASFAGPQPFSLLVSAASGAADSAGALVEGLAGPGVALALAPDPALAGRGSTAVLTLTVTNTGETVGSFDLGVDAPAGWAVELLANGQPVSAVTLPPHVFNSQDLTLLVTPSASATPGDYDLLATAVAQSDPDVSATVTGVVQVSNRGVQIAILSGPTTLDPRDTAVWNVRVTNSGQVADTYDLQAAGLFALVGEFSTGSVTLNPGQSQTVPFTADGLEPILPGVYDLVVVAQSQADAAIASQDVLAVTLLTYEAVEATFVPLQQTISNTLTATFMLVVTNTGNVNTLYEFSSDAPGASSQVSQATVQLPAHYAATVLVTVVVPGPGTYQVTGTAVSASGDASDSATAVLNVAGDAPPDNLILYLPVAMSP